MVGDVGNGDALDDSFLDDNRGEEATSVGDEEMLKSVRDSGFLQDLLDERDVSLVYIDRHQIHNYVGSRSGKMPVRTTDRVQPQNRRVGDQVINHISQVEIEQVRSVYRPPLPYGVAQQTLREHGLLVLCGPSGTGKRATALSLLAGLSFRQKNDLSLYELNPDKRLVDLDLTQLPISAGILVDDPSGDVLEGMARYHLESLAHHLANEVTNCALVVAVEHLPSDFPAESRHLVTEWNAEWDGEMTEVHRQIVSAHVRWHVRYDDNIVDGIEPELDGILDQSEVRKILSTPQPLAQLSDLALLLLPVLRGELTLDAALAETAKVAESEARHWFDQGQPPDLELLLIAAAAFNGAAYDDVTEAARRLEQLLDSEVEPEEPEPAPASRFRMADHRKSRLASVHARIVSATEASHFGEVPQEAVVLNNPGWQKAVLEFVWEFDFYREPMLQWLEENVNHSHHSMRMRAAATTGALARKSFAAIEARLLRRWANSASPTYRRAAAQVLGVTIWDDNHALPSSRLLHHWASQANNGRLQWTAATAYAGLAGLRFYNQTFADLKFIAAQCYRQPLLLPPITSAAVNAYAAAASIPDRRAELLQQLHEWSDTRRERRKSDLEPRSIRRTGLLAFWSLLWPHRQNQVWQQAISDFGVPGEMQAIAVSLIRRSLRFRQPKRTVSDSLHPRTTAIEAIHRMIVETAKLNDPDVEAYLAGLLKALVTACENDHTVGQDELDRLHFAANKWKDAKLDAPTLVGLLL